MVRTAVETCRPVADGFGHDVVVEIPREPIQLEADAVRFAVARRTAGPTSVLRATPAPPATA